MNRKMLLLSAALTAFVLVIIGGVASRLIQETPPLEPTPAAQETPTTVPAVAVDPKIEALIREREAAYRAALEEANRRLEEANQRLAAAQDALNSAATGAEAAASPTPNTPAPIVASAPTYAVSPEQAQAVALANAGGARLSRAPELVSLQGKPAYEVLFDRGAIYVDAQSGAVLASTLPAPQPAVEAAPAPAAPAPAASGAGISLDQAVAIATAYLGGGQVIELEREYEHGADVYKVKFSNGSEVYVNAVTGQVAYAKAQPLAPIFQWHDDEEDEDEEHAEFRAFKEEEREHVEEHKEKEEDD